MAQAVAAQALSRAAAALDDPALLTLAHRAFATIRYGLVQRASPGLWIKLYSFNSLAVLNAQLQSIVSLREYAQSARDSDAEAFAGQLEAAAESLLPRFDTGAWSLYALGGAEASLHYHDFVVSLLEQLADETPSPLWRDAAARFARYEHEPPRVVQRVSTTVAFPWPRDGYRDTVTTSFTVSKLAEVTLVVAGERRTATVPRGAGAITWRPGFLRLARTRRAWSRPTSPETRHRRRSARSSSATTAIHPGSRPSSRASVSRGGWPTRRRRGCGSRSCSSGPGPREW